MEGKLDKWCNFEHRSILKSPYEILARTKGARIRPVSPRTDNGILHHWITNHTVVCTVHVLTALDHRPCQTFEFSAQGEGFGRTTH